MALLRLAMLVGLAVPIAACTDDADRAEPTTTAAPTPTSPSTTPATAASTSQPVPPTDAPTPATSPPAVSLDTSPLLDLPLPAPVRVRRRAETTLEDPTFEPLPGARAHFGRLGGAVYQIEIPVDWNGRLLMWMHGYGELGESTSAAPPDFRRFLIANGYAWAASSYSSTSFIPGRGADETAALWDHFARRHGRPTWTYAAGISMGGWSALVAAERYANRYDGAFGMCGAAGVDPGLSTTTDMFVAGAYVAGVSQAEFDAAPSIGDLIERRIRPALEDPARRRRFEAIMIDLTGGARAFAVQGFRDEEDTNWTRAGLLVSARLVPRRERPYVLSPETGTDSDEFNDAAITIPTNDEAFRAFTADMAVTGDVQMPLITLHATGDGQSPIGQAQIIRRQVEAAGRGDLLVQRVIEDPGHCGFTTSEQEATFQALVDWVEHGRVPAGTDLDVDDLTELDHTFELVSRRVAGPDRRVALSGQALLDGVPFDARWLGAVVLHEGLATACNVSLPPVRDGRFSIGLYRERGSAGCGRSGDEVVLWTFVDETKLFATSAIPWPVDGKPAIDVEIEFSTRRPQGAAPVMTELGGEVYDRQGKHVPPGSLVEAVIDGTKCGVASVRGTDFYILAVVGPDSVPACAAGATVTLLVNGKPAAETAVNSPDRSTHLDLTV